MLFALFTSAMLAAISSGDVGQAAGETRRTINLPSAVARRGDQRPELKVVIWYPAVTGSREKPVTIGPPGKPLFEVAPLAQDARPKPGRYPVILLSHGFGGSAEDMGWLAAPLARAGYVLISVDHPGNNALDKTLVGATAWWERPRDLIAALQALTRDPKFGPLIDAQQVGAAGFSMGGTTVLALAGARIDPDAFDAFCRTHPTDGVCRPPAEMPDTPVANMKASFAKLGLTDAAAHAGEGTALPQVRAVLAIAPNSRALDRDSLRRIAVPTVVVSGGRDTVVLLENQARFAADAIPNAKLIRVPTAAHYSFLATCTDAGREVIDVCRLASDQSTAHRVAIDEALALFRKVLPSRRRRNGG